MANFLIVGASSGIGKELARQLAVKGHKVFGTYNQHQVALDNVEMHPLDVTAAELDLDFLTEQLDGVVYCPGLIDLKPFHRIKPEEFAADFQLQVIGAIKILQGVYPMLKNSIQASVVLFSTVAVQSGFTFHSKVAASKGAIEGLARALAAEWAPKIRVNVIAPSLTETPLSEKLLNSPEKVEVNAQRHPLKRIGKTIDMANAATFLLSDSSSWVSGQVLAVDGGMSSLKV